MIKLKTILKLYIKFNLLLKTCYIDNAIRKERIIKTSHQNQRLKPFKNTESQSLSRALNQSMISQIP